MKYIFAIALIVVISCNTKNPSPDKTIEAELFSLSTNELKKEYLEQVLVDDQKVRGSEGQELMIQYGKNSKEHMEYIHSQLKQDPINL